MKSLGETFVLVLALFYSLHERFALSFVVPKKALTTNHHYRQLERHGMVCLSLNVGSAAVVNPASLSVEEASQALLNLLVSNKEGGNERNRDLEMILVQRLISAKVVFDPIQCLDGPLYYSTVMEGPSPLWKGLGLSSSTNVQGQQYTYKENEKSVVNYAEILGKALHLRAYGSFEPDPSSPLYTQDLSSQSDESSPLSSFMDAMLSGLSNNDKDKKESLIQCPADFVVTVNKASIFLGSKSLLDIPVSGEGYLRVLYADSKLRIFVSPTSTTDDRWEKAGLTVAQVSIELLDPKFERLV